MRNPDYAGLAGLGVLLFLGVTQVARPSQNANPPTSPAHNKPAQMPPAAGHLSHQQQCSDIEVCVEQIEEQARIIEKKVQAKVAEIEGQVAKEVEMSSPELSKLNGFSAKLEGNRGEIEARAEELRARAEELGARAEELAQQTEEKAQRVFSGEPPVFVAGIDEGGWLGVEIGEVTAEKAKDMRLASVRGVIVDDVEPDSPAAKAGVKEKDVITQYDGQAVEGTVQFRRLVRETPAGRTVTLTISRGGSLQTISVELGDRGAYFEKKMKGRMRDFGEAYAFSAPTFAVELPDMPEAMDMRTPSLGISAEDLTGQLGSYFGAPNDSGVLVREVRAGTPAEKAGLKAGDVIVKVEGKQVRTLAELRAQLREKSGQPSVTMAVLRKGSEITVTVPIEKPRPMEQMHTVHRAQM